MKKIFCNYRLAISFLVLFACCKKFNGDKSEAKIIDHETYLSTVKKLTDVIVYDVFSPPVASRVYVYPNIAAYETMIHAHKDKYISLSGQLNGLTKVPEPNQNKEIDFHIAALQAYGKVAKELIFSEDDFESFIEVQFNEIKNRGVGKLVMENSLVYGDVVAKHILAWAGKDGYKESRSYPKYNITDTDSLWTPTPPNYISGIEPHWTKIRTMVLDSSTQFKPIPPLKFDLDESSRFYKQLKEVYDVGRELDEEQKGIASFWDCNPYVVHHQGHAMFATKKITPGGHWVGITSIASRLSNSTFDESIETSTLVSIALFDAFISCWDEKWRSLLVRPETLINQYIDEDWLPLLQTPPFPEYTSGHSVISRAAAVTLTDHLGNLSFTDSTEMEFGLPARKFNSFLEASEEAAISRLYGGIHYRMAIENGIIQGDSIGHYITRKIRTRIDEE